MINSKMILSIDLPTFCGKNTVTSLIYHYRLDSGWAQLVLAKILMSNKILTVRDFSKLTSEFTEEQCTQLMLFLTVSNEITRYNHQHLLWPASPNLKIKVINLTDSGSLTLSVSYNRGVCEGIPFHEED